MPNQSTVSPHSCPAVLLAAPASGHGKTTVVAALARLHSRQGRRVQVFKCGPDFLDPGWLALASGRPVHNLDLWICGEEEVQRRLHAAAGESDLILVEGVMGLFDGRPSAADIAQRFDIPVLAVINAASMAETFGALAHGLQHWRPGLRWAGSLANRVASSQHAEMIAQAMEGQSYLGAVHASSSFGLPERHLGLTAAQEMDDALQRLDTAADALLNTPLGRMDLDALAAWNTRFEPPASRPQVPALLAGKTIAVARDEAFQFIYEANIDTLQALGASVRFFSPLADSALPECDAIWLPGGYPELHAARLEDNCTMGASLRAHAEAGKPVWAECGGMMALFDALYDMDGQAHAMWGVLPGTVRMQKRLAGLGSQQLALAGYEPLRGHTFHYSVSETQLPEVARTGRPGQTPAVGAGEAVYQRGNVRASYFHPWFASSPLAVASLFSPSAEGIAP